MARLEDLPSASREAIAGLDCPSFDARPWVRGPALVQRRVAMISSAALHLRDEAPFAPGSAEFRTLAADAPAHALRMSHVSINYDRSGWQRDVNTIYPLDRLREMAASGAIGAVAHTHYSVMGSTDPRTMEQTADGIARRLKQERVDAVLLSPV